MTNKQVMQKMDIYNFEYIDKGFLFKDLRVGKAIDDESERFITTVKACPNEKNYISVMENAINTSKSAISRTISIDYRLITDELIHVLEEAFDNDTICGIRLLPEGTPLTKEVYNRVNTRGLQGILFTADGVDKDVDLTNSRINFYDQKGLFVIEKSEYNDIKNDNCIFNENYNIHITKELREEELKHLVKLAALPKFTNIIVDFYEPSYYKRLVNSLNNLSIRKNIKLKFLANPLYDEVSLYDELEKISKNPITIQYNTCNDLNNFYKDEPRSETIRYYSDIEASGVTNIKTYNKMLNMIDNIVSHMENKSYSPLEKVCYLYDYFKDNYRYNSNYKNESHSDNSDLDKVFSKNEMICEGFSNLFSAILRRAGVLCFTYGTDNHQKNMIRVLDDKYKVDKLALLDITWDLSPKDNLNSFENFLVDLRNDLYAPTPEVINVPTSLFITQETYDNYIQLSNPVYSTDAIGCAIRMLKLMGLGHGSNKFESQKELYNYYRDSLKNSKLLGTIDTNVLANAITRVRENENKYKDKTLSRESDKKDVIGNLIARGNYSLSAIKTIDGEEVYVDEYNVGKPSIFARTKPQNQILSYPRKKLSNETQAEYDEYLKNFYYGKFILGLEEIEDKKKDKVKEKIKQIKEVRKPDNETTQTIESKTDPNKKLVAANKKEKVDMTDAIEAAMDKVELEDKETQDREMIERIKNNVARKLKEEEMEQNIVESLDEAMDKVDVEEDKSHEEMIERIKNTVARKLKEEEMEQNIAESLDEAMDKIEVKDTVKEAKPVEEVKFDIEEIPEEIDLTNALDDAMNSVEIKDEVKIATPVEPKPEFKYDIEEIPEEVDLTNALDEAMNKVEVKEPVKVATKVHIRPIYARDKKEEVDLTAALDDAMDKVEVKDEVKIATPVEDKVEVNFDVTEEPEEVDLTNALDEAMNSVEVKDTVKIATPVESKEEKIKKIKEAVADAINTEEKTNDIDLTNALDDAMDKVELKETDTTKEATPVEDKVEVNFAATEEPEEVDLTDTLDEAMDKVEVTEPEKDTETVEEEKTTPAEESEDIDLTDALDEAMDDVEVKSEEPKEEYSYDIEEIEEEVDKPKKKEGKLKKLLNKIKSIPATIKNKVSKKSKKKSSKRKKKEGFFKKILNKFKKTDKPKKKEGFFKKLANKVKKHIIPAGIKDEKYIKSKAKNKKETKKPVEPEVDLTEELDNALDKITVNDSTTKEDVIEKEETKKENPTDNKVKIEEEIIAKPINKPVTKIEEEIIAKPIDKPVTKIEEEIIAKPIEKDSSYKAMTADEIKRARKNIEADKYDRIYGKSKDELLPGTDVIKPRDKYLCETDEEYQEYVRDYMERHFPVDQPKEYIPGTDILKPRNRGTYESEEEYEEYLRMYYDYYLTPKMEEQKEDITIYSDEDTNYLYVTNEVADKYELRSARFAAKINEVLCYRISMDDARSLVEKCNVKIELYQRKYERTDEEYLSFDKAKVLTK